MTNIHFCSFANSRMAASLERIGQQALDLGVFKNIYIWNENDLNINFKARYEERLILGTRGYGYWVWKSHIIRKILDDIGDEDILLYADAGCHLNKEGLKRFGEYIDLVNNSKSGLLLFEQNGFVERCWTKGDVFDYFEVRDVAAITETPQRAATILLMKKCKFVINLIDIWSEIYEKNFCLFDDTESHSPNLSGFMEHRHDQSVLSILTKIHGCEIVPVAEIYSQDWATMKSYPIWAKRDKRLKPIYLFLRKYRTASQLIRKLLLGSGN